ncbi:MAG: ABC transporter permease [Anaerolineales bacterium]|nr:ABC transporter permease [Anaerolineales bacterium]
MRILDLAFKDIRQLLRDWKTAFFLLIMPVGFTLLFGFIFGGIGGGEEVDPRLPVLVEDRDGSEVSAYLLTFLDMSEVIRSEDNDALDAEAVQEAVLDGDYAAAVIVPADYGEEALQGGRPKLIVYVDPTSEGGTSAQLEVSARVNRLMSAVQTAVLATEQFEEQQAFAGEAARTAFVQDTLAKAVAAWDDPAVTMKTAQTGMAEETEGDDENAYAHSSPGMMAQFAIAGLIGAAEILVQERKARALARLLTTAISRFEILIGHYLAMFLMIFGQIMILMIFGQLLLKLDYFAAPVSSLLIAVTTAMCAAAMGLLIGALSKSEENAVVFSLVPMFIFSGIGGAWLPLEFTSETVQKIGHLSPVAWTMDGFKNILIRGQGLEAAWLPALILFGFAVVFFALGAWRFSFRD